MNNNKNNNKVEIVLIRFNLKEIEDRAIQCVKDNTKHPYKLTIIDNYKNNIPLSVLWNQAIEKSDCKYVCLLNSDAFVTEGWLTEMMGGFINDKITAVGPSGDKVGGTQREIGNVRLAQQHIGKYREIDLLSGFCMLLRKDINIEFPEEVPFYGGEHAWEVIAKRKGYKFIWAQGAFVYHLGEASGKKEGNIDRLREEGLKQYVHWLAKTTPVLFITYNRLEYTKKSLLALLNSITGGIYIYDNKSDKDTIKYLSEIEAKYPNRVHTYFAEKNTGVAGAMNWFFGMTGGEEFVAKVDNDTIVPKYWLQEMAMMATIRRIDIIQAKHAILNGKYATFEEWMTKLKQDEKNEHIFYSEYVGGSGIIIRRDKIKEEVIDSKKWKWVLGGWTHFQEKNPNLKKAFCNNVEVELLDMIKDNEPRYNDYPDYYVKVGRVKIRNKNVADTLAEIIFRLGKRFAYLRFGDGELMMMENFKGHPHTQWVTPKFKEELTESFLVDHKDYLIGNITNISVEVKAQPGMFMPFQNNAELLKITEKYYVDKTFYNPVAFHYIYTFEKALWELMLSLLSKYKIGFVGGEHLRAVTTRFGIKDFVVTPSEQSYNTIDKWYSEVEEIAKRNDILLLSLSMTANIVQKRLWQSGINIGTIDFGSVANAITNYTGDRHTWIARAKQLNL